MNDVLVFLIVGLVIVAFFWLGVRSRERTVRQDVLVRPVDPEAVEAVVNLVGRGRKVQAIKELRRFTGMGLAEAKALTEAIQSGHRPKPPPTDDRPA
jgi:hypothetical protein